MFTILRASSTSLQTYRHSSMSHHSRTRTFLTAFNWVIHLQHQLVAFIDSRVWPSTVEFLTVSTGVKIILADLGSTCNVLLSPVALTLHVDWDQCFTVLFLQSLVITPAQFIVEQDTGISHIRFRLSKPHGFDLRLVGFILIFWSVLMITFDSSWADLLSQLSLASRLEAPCSVLLHVSRFQVLRCKNFACCWHCSSLFTGSGVPVPGCFASRVLGSLPWLFLFFTAIWHVFQPAYNAPPWSESKGCPQSLQTALLWTSHK